MNDKNSLWECTGNGAEALDARAQASGGKLTDEDRSAILEAGRELSQKDEIWLLISGKFSSNNYEKGLKGTEGRVRDLMHCLGYPSTDANDSERVLHVLLDSPGGSLDSAYSVALYMAEHARKIKVYVPRRAKSASMLLALRADELHLSVFGELGPLDTQVHDPRNPLHSVSALDCYQSVDYVRDFGINAMREMLHALADETNRWLSLEDAINKSLDFSLGAINPILRNVTALDFGGWGRSLRIAERYTLSLLEAKARANGQESGSSIHDIARKLVFGYTHHLYPIDFHEAASIPLPVHSMDVKTYEAASKVVDLCKGKDFVTYISEREVQLQGKLTEETPDVSSTPPLISNGHKKAEADISEELDLESG